jgi:hypothetical protein
VDHAIPAGHVTVGYSLVDRNWIRATAVWRLTARDFRNHSAAQRFDGTDALVDVADASA